MHRAARTADRRAVPAAANARPFTPARYAFDKLKPEDQKALVTELKQSDPPAHIKTIDPNDPSFLKKKTLDRVAPPVELKMPLLPYQQEGHGWMRAQEADDTCRGGILADEMGMGKTIQTISTIVASVVDARKSVKQRSLDSEVAPTLIVCPSSAMLQWADEINRSTAAGTLSVLVVYGKRDKLTKEEIMRHDVVLTSYPIIEYEYRKLVSKGPRIVLLSSVA